MKTKLFSTVFFIFFISIVSAQLKVNQNGKAIIGTVTPSTSDINNVLTMHVFGKSTDGYAPQIALGDYGSAPYSNNVVVGEYGNSDTDQLWLHGKLGTYLTCYNNVVIGYYNLYEGNKFNFNCDVWSSGIKLTSDERLKINISKINNSMANLQKLNGVSYFLLDKQMYIKNHDFKNISNISEQTTLTEKEKESKTFLDTFYSNIQNTKPKRMGFLAQDLQKVFPELVEKDSLGYYSVDYIGLIPVIIEALKEQQNTIDLLNQRLAALEPSVKSKISSNETATPAENDPLTYLDLDQNIPNPFNTATTIGFYLPTTFSNANIYVYDMNGAQLKSYNISARGKGNITIQGSELTAGMYLYALIADGKVIDTKRMILTK